jgi:hypothetical protein
MKDPVYKFADVLNTHRPTHCSICGGLVVDEEKHTSFHRSLANLLGIDVD